MRIKILRNVELKKKICLSPDLVGASYFLLSKYSRILAFIFKVNVLLILFLRQEKYKQIIINDSGVRNDKIEIRF
jgi:hypothetical protein